MVQENKGGAVFMVMWNRFEGSSDDWDQYLLTSKDYTIFQSHDWGEYKSFQGWIPCRYAAFDKNKRVIAMAQVLRKAIPLGFSMLWIPGGPALEFPGSSRRKLPNMLATLMATLQSDYARSLIRMHQHRAHDSELSALFAQVCKRPVFKLLSGYTIQMTPVARESFLRQMTSKHRYYVKKSEREGLIWTEGRGDTDIRALNDIHQEMCDRKQLAALATSADDTRRMVEALGEGVSILTGRKEGQHVSACLTLNFGKKSFYMSAATGQEGRAISAAYAMMAELMSRLADRGITAFDFGGINPASSAAAGVDHFKRGFGGEIIEHLGEWEVAPSEWLRWGLNIALKLKGGGA